MIVENSVYWIRELIAHCQRKYQHNSYSDSNGPLCEDLQDPQQHSCKKLEYIRTSQLFIAGGGGKWRIWGRPQGFPGKRRGDQHKHSPKSSNPSLLPPTPPAINEDRSMKVNLIGKIE